RQENHFENSNYEGIKQEQRELPLLLWFDQCGNFLTNFKLSKHLRRGCTCHATPSLVRFSKYFRY
ncbi:MAG: hypothetical protein UHS47_03520, partial [Oscillospiraceae bacterium]|nr:hypothetical protein [Oscillospiraceae bacterium]